jgi:hypothetical protein
MPKLKDVFVDNNVAKNFCNPVDPEFKEFVRWLFLRGTLVVSNKIINEYSRSCGGSHSRSNILVIIDHQLRRKRLMKISNAEIDSIAFTKAELRLIKSNRSDHQHLKVVRLSRRRLVITNDGNFANDVVKLPCISGRASDRPEQLPYREG